MKACILARTNTTDDEITALKRFAESRFDEASFVIRTTHLNIMDIIDAIRLGGYKRVYVQSGIHLGRVVTEMIALAVCLEDIGIGIISQDGTAITDDLLIHSLEREIIIHYQYGNFIDKTDGKT